MTERLDKNSLLMQLQTYKLISDAYEDSGEADQPIKQAITTHIELAQRILDELKGYEQTGNQAMCEESRQEILRTLSHLRTLMRQMLQD